MLDIECFTYLNKALESPISPIVVLASNRGMATIRGADDIVAAHGIPPDFLTRLLIIPTTPYGAEEIKRIVTIRANTEGVKITEAAIDKISEHGVRISLRYCLQLLTPARYVLLLGAPAPPACLFKQFSLVHSYRGIFRFQCHLRQCPPFSLFHLQLLSHVACRNSLALSASFNEIRRSLTGYYSILAKVNGRNQIDVQDVAECEDLFLDARRSAQVLSSELGQGYLP